MKKTFLKKIDWWIISALIPLLILSLSTISSLTGGSGSHFALRQLVWTILSFGLLFFVASIDLSFLKQSKFLVLLYGFGVSLLIALMFVGDTVNGSKSWFSFGFFSFQPADMLKLILILVLAKYLSRRHVEIKAMKHVVITALYFLVPFVLIFLQPDFGSAIILFFIWLGMILISGISKRHLMFLFILGFAAFMIMWLFVFQEYQKNRLRTFIDPLSDIRGAGYNAYQSTIAVGSGQLLGKGVGYGTQSRLNFLPEYQTDFIFAAISEEWGFIGSLVVIILLAIIILRIISLSFSMNNNFERLFAVGVSLYFISHIIVNVGMNIGIMPVTGVTLPFLSYGGSHLLIEYGSLGMLMSLRGRTRVVYQDQSPEVFLR